eukprot:COSAG02_NODE_2523_length_8608_cov_10.605124_2_plen_180_part_00
MIPVIDSSHDSSGDSSGNGTQPEKSRFDFGYFRSHSLTHGHRRAARAPAAGRATRASAASGNLHGTLTRGTHFSRSALGEGWSREVGPVVPQHNSQRPTGKCYRLWHADSGSSWSFLGYMVLAFAYSLCQPLAGFPVLTTTLSYPRTGDTHELAVEGTELDDRGAWARTVNRARAWHRA